MRNMYQILFDYIARNLNFWRCYSKTLKVKYIFFINNQEVAKIRFEKIIHLASRYKFSLGEPLSERRLIAEKLLKILNFKQNSNKEFLNNSSDNWTNLNFYIMNKNLFGGQIIKDSGIGVASIRVVYKKVNIEEVGGGNR